MSPEPPGVNPLEPVSSPGGALFDPDAIGAYKVWEGKEGNYGRAPRSLLWDGDKWRASSSVGVRAGFVPATPLPTPLLHVLQD